MAIRKTFIRSKSLLLAALVGIAFTGAALADCSTDLAKLDAALKGTTLSAQAKGDLGGARTKAADLLKANDDKACSKVIMDAAAKAGVKM